MTVCLRCGPHRLSHFSWSFHVHFIVTSLSNLRGYSSTNTPHFFMNQLTTGIFLHFFQHRAPISSTIYPLCHSKASILRPRFLSN